MSKSKKAISTTVYKATSYKPKPSKEKHVRVIILRTFATDTSKDDIIRALQLRMDKQNWAVVTKCLMIFHRLFRDGDGGFMEAIKGKSGAVFSLQKFSATAPSQHAFTLFVKKYAKYLEEKCSVYRLLGYQFEKNKSSVESLETSSCFKIVAKLQSQMNALLNCKIRSPSFMNNQLIHRAYILIMKDSLTLYTMLNTAILQLLDMFWKVKKSHAAKILSIYKLFCKETDALISLYDIGKSFVKQLPDITPPESSIIDAMEKHVEGLAADGGGEDSNGEQTKKKDKSKKKAAESAELDEKDSVTDAVQEDSGSTPAGDESSDKESSSDDGDDDNENDFLKDILNSLGPLATPSLNLQAPFANISQQFQMQQQLQQQQLLLFQQQQMQQQQRQQQLQQQQQQQFQQQQLQQQQQQQLQLQQQQQYQQQLQQQQQQLQPQIQVPAPSPTRPNPFAAPTSNPFAVVPLTAATTSNPFAPSVPSVNGGNSLGLGAGLNPGLSGGLNVGLSGGLGYNAGLSGGLGVGLGGGLSTGGLTASGLGSNSSSGLSSGSYGISGGALPVVSNPFAPPQRTTSFNPSPSSTPFGGSTGPSSNIQLSANLGVTGNFGVQQQQSNPFAAPPSNPFLK